jgi:hypothetical protein
MCGPHVQTHLRSDLQVVPSNCNRDAVMSLVIKQLKSLGVPFVHDICHAAENLGMTWPVRLVLACDCLWPFLPLLLQCLVFFQVENQGK